MTTTTAGALKFTGVATVSTTVMLTFINGELVENAELKALRQFGYDVVPRQEPRK